MKVSTTSTQPSIKHTIPTTHKGLTQSKLQRVDRSGVPPGGLMPCNLSSVLDAVTKLGSSAAAANSGIFSHAHIHQCKYASVCILYVVSMDTFEAACGCQSFSVGQCIAQSNSFFSHADNHKNNGLLSFYDVLVLVWVCLYVNVKFYLIFLYKFFF